jgi:hypothetical protein
MRGSNVFVRVPTNSNDRAFSHHQNLWNPWNPWNLKKERLDAVCVDG